MGFSSFLRSIGNSIKNTVNQIIDTGRDICNGIIDRIDIWRGREEEVRKRKEKERQMEIEREKARQREIERMKEEERERERQRQIQQMREAAERRERERLREIKKKYNNYRPSHVDQQLAQKAKTYIDKKFPNGVRETMRNTPPRKREELFNEVVNDACEIMDVRLNSVHYDEMKGNTAGIYRGRDNSLHLNAYMVTSSL